MDITWLEVEEIDGVIRIECDQLSEQSVRQGLLRHNIQLTESETLVHHKQGDILLQLVEFHALSTTKEEVDFSLADSLKLVRPYPKKAAPKMRELQDSSD